ncbi:hypothetical protein [Marinobacter mangrovi]|uniref:hypothetical protein n=1 Tax=Marinobacter mangrovi TaxID=2803918 RepID=UPI001931C2B3|nr:hypothetical protein [Marinobacter mangrovi]
MPTPLYQRWLPILFGLALLFPASELHAEKPQLTLAQVYEKGDALKGYWVSKKLDGVRAYWDGEHLISRQGHAFHPPTWFTRDFPEVPLDGEPWMGRGTFSELSGVVRKLDPVDSAEHMTKIAEFPWDSLEDKMEQSVPNLREAAMVQTLTSPQKGRPLRSQADPELKRKAGSEAREQTCIPMRGA